MAGDWVSMRTDLDEDPAVVAVASRLVYAGSRFQITQLNDVANAVSARPICAEVIIVGALWKLWSIADRQSENGTLPGYGIGVIDAKVGIDGFSEALAEQGWLRIHKWGLEIPNFDHHNGRSAKARAKQRLRASFLRTNLVNNLTHLNDVANAVSAPTEEKRTDNKKPPLVPQQEDQPRNGTSKPKSPARREPKADSRFEEFWSVYPKKIARRDAIKAWEKLNPDDALVQTILAAVHRQSRWEQWRREKGKYIPNASTWLNGARWEDADVEATQSPPRTFFVAPAQSQERHDGVSSLGDLFSGGDDQKSKGSDQ